MIRPFFSVIIPTLNEEKYLPTILKSLAKQTFRDFELILVDASSDDNTLGIFDEFKKYFPQCQVLISKRRNVGYQRNLGAKQAKGKYLVFFDADVDIPFTFLEEIHLAAIKQDFPFATTWIQSDSENQVDLLLVLLANLGTELIKGINKPFAGGYNTIVKPEIFAKLHGFAENLHIGEDHDLSLRAYKKKIELTILKEPKLTMSLRRLRKEGKLKALSKYAQSQLHTILKGPMTEALFDYPMGGHVHSIRKSKKRRVKFKLLDKYLVDLEKMENKIANYLSENI